MSKRGGNRKDRKDRKDERDRKDESAASPSPAKNVFLTAGLRVPWSETRALRARYGQSVPCPNCGSHSSLMRKSEPTEDGRLVYRSCKRCHCCYRVVEITRRPPPGLSDRRIRNLE